MPKEKVYASCMCVNGRGRWKPLRILRRYPPQQNVFGKQKPHAETRRRALARFARIRNMEFSRPRAPKFAKRSAGRISEKCSRNPLCASSRSRAALGPVVPSCRAKRGSSSTGPGAALLLAPRRPGGWGGAAALRRWRQCETSHTSVRQLQRSEMRPGQPISPIFPCTRLNDRALVS